MKVVFNLTDSQIEQLNALYQNEWWTKGRTLADTYSVIRGSTLNVAIVDGDDNLIGYARVLTDFVYKAFIYDVIVLEKERGNGIGELIMTTILTHDQIANVEHVELYCRDELVEYYQRYGFSTEVGPINLMRKQKT